jgi:hypothetical protein
MKFRLTIQISDEQLPSSLLVAERSMVSYRGVIDELKGS